MDQKIINGTTRTTTGKSEARRMRKTGRLPAVMYDGNGKATAIDIEEKEFSKIYHLITESTLIDLKLDGSKDFVAFVKDIQYNIISDRVGHVDFYAVDPTKVLHTKIPVRLSGSPVGVRQGGILETGLTHLVVECLPRDLPPRCVVDVSNLELKHSIHVRDLKLGDKIKIISNPDATVATMKYNKTDAEVAPAAGATPAAE